jgi:hypothetical protein
MEQLTVQEDRWGDKICLKWELSNILCIYVSLGVIIKLIVSSFKF